MTTAQRLTRNKALLLLDHGLFGELACRLECIEDNTVDTGCTDGKKIFYNKAWVDSLTDRQIQGFLAHEAMHPGNKHLWRRDNRDLEDWNLACDGSINPHLIACGIELPPGAFLPEGEPRSAEALYTEIHRPQQQQQDEDDQQQDGDDDAGAGAGDSDNSTEDENADDSDEGGSDGQTDAEDGDQAAEGDSEPDSGAGSSPGNGSSGSEEGDEPKNQPQSGSSAGDGQTDVDGNEEAGSANSEPVSRYPSDKGGCGSFVDPAGDEDGDTADLEAEWQEALAQAAATAEAQGTLPAHLKRLVQSILEPEVPFAVLLRDFVERTARNDYNWQRPSMRHLNRGVYMPSLISEELPEVVIVLDTSGSCISPKILERFASEASGVLMAYETKVRLIYCDTKIQGEVEEITRADMPFKFEPRGFGGTDFRPPFEWVEKEGLQPSCLIYLTDLAGTFPDKEPDYPVLWVSVREEDYRYKTPFGQVVVIREEE